MADTDSLRNYKPQGLPQIQADAPRFTAEELQRVSNTLANIIEVMKKMDKRMIIAGI